MSTPSGNHGPATVQMSVSGAFPDLEGRPARATTGFGKLEGPVVRSSRSGTAGIPDQPPPPVQKPPPAFKRGLTRLQSQFMDTEAYKLVDAHYEKHGVLIWFVGAVCLFLACFVLAMVLTFQSVTCLGDDDPRHCSLSKSPYENQKDVQGWGVASAFLELHPRVGVSGLAPRSLDLDQDFNTIDSENFREAQAFEYSVGLLTLSVFALLSMILFPLCSCCFWIGRCVGPCCCNYCGGKKAPDEGYTTFSQLCHRLCQAMLVCALLAFGMVGHSANIGFSSTIDRAENTGDLLVNVTGEVDVILDSALVLGDDVLLVVDDMVDFLNETIPNATEVQGYKDCITGVISVTDTSKLVTVLRDLDNQLNNDLPDLTSVNATIDQLRLGLAALPNLTLFANELDRLNRSVGNAPNASSVKPELAALNATFNQLRADTFRIRNVSLPLLAANLGDVNTSVNAVEEDIDDYETSFALLDDPVPPVLSVLVSFVAGNFTGPVSEFRGNLSLLNESMAILPNGTEFGYKIDAINGTFTAVGVSLGTLARDVEALRDTVMNRPNTTRLKEKILEVDAFLATSFGIANITRRLARVNESVSAIDAIDLAQMIADIKAVQNATISVQSEVIANLTDQLVEFNETIKTAFDCVFDDVLGDIQHINDTVLGAPQLTEALTTMQDLEEQVTSNLTTFHDKITEAHQNLLDLNATFNDLPNFDNMTRDIEAFNDTRSSLPNMTELTDQVNSFNDSITQLRATNFTNYTMAIDDFERDVNLTQLNNTLNTLYELRASLLNATNQNYTGQKSTALDADQDKAELQPQVNSMLNLTAYLNPSDPMPSLTFFQTQDSSLNSFGDNVAGLEDTTANRSDNTAVKNSLADVKNDAAAVDLTGVDSDVEELENSFASFPDIETLNADVDNAESAKADLPDLSTTAADLRRMNADVDALPDLEKTQRDISDMEKQRADTPINKTISDIEEVKTNAPTNETMNQLDKILEFRDDGFRQIREARENIDSNLADFDEKRADAWKQVREPWQDGKDETIPTVHKWDARRIAAYNVLVFLPLLISLMGLVGCCLPRCSYCSYIMSCAFCVCGPLFFLLSAAMLPMAVLLNDQCPLLEKSADSIMLSYNNETWQEPIHIDAPVNASTSQQELFKYYTVCDLAEPEPELFRLDVVDNTKKEIRSRANSTEIQEEVEREQNITFRPKVIAYFDRMEGLVPRVEGLVDDVVDFAKCPSISPKYTAVRDVFCEEFLQAYASLAVTLLMLGLIMCCGFCCGVKQFKRFRYVKKNESEPSAGDEDFDRL